MTPLFSGPSQTGEQPQGSQFLDASMPCACLDVDIVYDSRRNDFQRAARQRCWPGSTCACIGKSLRLPAQGQPIGDLRGITVGYSDHAPDELEVHSILFTASGACQHACPGGGAWRRGGTATAAPVHDLGKRFTRRLQLSLGVRGIDRFFHAGYATFQTQICRSATLYPSRC